MAHVCVCATCAWSRRPEAAEAPHSNTAVKFVYQQQPSPYSHDTDAAGTTSTGGAEQVCRAAPCCVPPHACALLRPKSPFLAVGVSMRWCWREGCFCSYFSINLLLHPDSHIIMFSTLAGGPAVHGDRRQQQ